MTHHTPNTTLRTNRAHYLLWFFFTLVAFALSACSNSSSPGPQLLGQTMGTTYSVQWTTLPTDLDSKEIQTKIERRLLEINQSMSTYDPKSALSEFNASRETGWHASDTELVKLVHQALEINRLSAGAFDVTVGPLVNLWGFGTAKQNFIFPSDVEIRIAQRTVGSQNIKARLDPPALWKNNPDVYIDLSAIAKGYAVDEIAEILDQYEIADYMVEIGGEVKGKGLAPHGEAWRIGIETPNATRASIEAVVALDKVGVATSGDYRNYFEHDGKHYAHTIDPTTGRPVEHELASVTVVHSSVALADAWATAFMVLGPEHSLSLARDHDIAALFLTREENNFQQTMSPAMRDHLISTPK